MPYFVGDALEKASPNAPFGCVNGGGLYDPWEGRYVWYQPIREDVIELVRYVDGNTEDMGIQVNCTEHVYFSRENETMTWFRRITGVPNLVADYDKVTEPMLKIVFGDMREERLMRVKALLDSHPRYSDFDYIRSEKSLYEILPKGVSKGTVLPRLAEHLGIDMRRTVAIGDYDNDVSMLKAAGLGIAVANATSAARAVADIITVSNEEHALARIIYDIECGNIKI
jgi:Cof subfamily protein (haloacid dehalogenase superfamily)